MVRVLRKDVAERVKELETVAAKYKSEWEDRFNCRGCSAHTHYAEQIEYIESVKQGSALREETWGEYWVRRCWELTQELFVLEKGEDSDFPLDSEKFEAFKNFKVRELENARVALSRCEYNVQVDVRQTVNIAILF